MYISIVIVMYIVVYIVIHIVIYIVLVIVIMIIIVIVIGRPRCFSRAAPGPLGPLAAGSPRQPPRHLGNQTHIWFSVFSITQQGNYNKPTSNNITSQHIRTTQSQSLSVKLCST